MLKKLIADYGLCARLCFIDCSPGPIVPEAEGLRCEIYNQRINTAIEYLKSSLPSFAVVENTMLLQKEQKGIILVENGRFFGMGYMPASSSVTSIEELKNHITPYPESGYIRGLVYQYATRHPETKRVFVQAD